MQHEYDDRLARIERKLDELAEAHRLLSDAMVGQDGGNGIRAVVKHHEAILTDYPPRQNYENIKRVYWLSAGIAVAVSFIANLLGLETP